MAINTTGYLSKSNSESIHVRFLLRKSFFIIYFSIILINGTRTKFLFTVSSLSGL